MFDQKDARRIIFPLLLAAFAMSPLPLSNSATLPPQTCKSMTGSLVHLTASMMNDEYCDCWYTGEDEPATSACSHVHPSQVPSTEDHSSSWFHCSTKTGHERDVILRSRVSDGICDCCDGSDERTGPSSSPSCPDTCSRFLSQLLSQATRQLEIGVQGYKKRSGEKAASSSERSRVEGKLDALKREREKANELGITIRIYKSFERKYVAGFRKTKKAEHPRIDYKLQARRLRAQRGMDESRGVKTKVSRSHNVDQNDSLYPVLSTKCPTSDFTLDDFLMVSVAPLNDPRKRIYKKVLAEDTLVAPFLEDPVELLVRIVGLVVFGPVRAVKGGLQLCWTLAMGESVVENEDVDSGEVTEESSGKLVAKRRQ